MLYRLPDRPEDLAALIIEQVCFKTLNCNSISRIN